MVLFFFLRFILFFSSVPKFTVYAPLGVVHNSVFQTWDLNVGGSTSFT